MRNLLAINDLSVQEIDSLIRVAKDIMAHPQQYSTICHGKKLATLFFEPSTRTRLSFEAAMYELGGCVLSVPGASLSSAAKGESVADTAKVVSCYADIIAMRHPKEGAPLVAAAHSDIPIINAGDGGHNHPTQTLADLLTIHLEKGGFDHLTVGFCGDLRYGRTVHSLMQALSRYRDVRFVLISPPELRVPEYLVQTLLKAHTVSFVETDTLEEALPSLDILYMTRIQKERFPDEASYERLKDSYILTKEKLTAARKDLAILHPLPRVNEISVSVDADPRACYFRQVRNGKYMREALILKLLGLSENAGEDTRDMSDVEERDFVCRNPHCIISTEQELPRLFRNRDGKVRCLYCEQAYGLPLNDKQSR